MNRKNTLIILLALAVLALAGAAQLLRRGPAASAASTPPQRRILKWRNPMDPTVFSDHAQKDNMGMDYIPVYEDEPAAEAPATASAAAEPPVPEHASFTLSEERRQLIGVRSEPATDATLVRTLRLPGRAGEAPGVVLAQALEMDGPSLRSGQRAQVLVAGTGPVPARVVSVDRALDAYSRSFELRLALSPGALPALRPGMYCDVRVLLEVGHGVSIPKEAVVDTGDHQVVFVERDGGLFDPREVDLGPEGDERVLVRSGIASGDRVVTSANFLIDSESRFQAAARDFGAGHD
jgi:hypothetical protein